VTGRLLSLRDAAVCSKHGTERACPPVVIAHPGEATELSSSLIYIIIKRLLDFSVALVLIVATAPLYLLAAALVKLTSDGPVVYTQVRVGRGRRLFTIYKIRTMYDDCERLTGPRWSTENDPRVTPVGRFLRRTHLDELPQLWNVLKGEMSLVGPRPERPEFVGRLEKELPRYGERLGVDPGVTGLAQVNLPPDTDHECVRRKLVYDLYYMENRGLWIDLRIIVGTGLFLLGVPFAASSRLLGLRPEGMPVLEPLGRPRLHDPAGVEMIAQALPSWRET
jgi:lipopolysaccharide/colanic/teichoic acid biosynthesis glycosyltransferase